MMVVKNKTHLMKEVRMNKLGIMVSMIGIFGSMQIDAGNNRRLSVILTPQEDSDLKDKFWVNVKSVKSSMNLATMDHHDEGITLTDEEQIIDTKGKVRINLYHKNADDGKMMGRSFIHEVDSSTTMLHLTPKITTMEDGTIKLDADMKEEIWTIASILSTALSYWPF